VCYIRKKWRSKEGKINKKLKRGRMTCVKYQEQSQKKADEEQLKPMLSKRRDLGELKEGLQKTRDCSCGLKTLIGK
jgi:hypothetical protein